MSVFSASRSGLWLEVSAASARASSSFLVEESCCWVGAGHQRRLAKPPERSKLTQNSDKVESKCFSSVPDYVTVTAVGELGMCESGFSQWATCRGIQLDLLDGHVVYVLRAKCLLTCMLKNHAPIPSNTEIAMCQFHSKMAQNDKLADGLVSVT